MKKLIMFAVVAVMATSFLSCTKEFTLTTADLKGNIFSGTNAAKNITFVLNFLDETKFNFSMGGAIPMSFDGTYSVEAGNKVKLTYEGERVEELQAESAKKLVYTVAAEKIVLTLTPKK